VPDYGQRFGANVSDTVQFLNYEHTYGVSAFDSYNHTYYAVIRGTVHSNSIVSIDTRTATVVSHAPFSWEISTLEFNPQFADYRHSYLRPNLDTHLRAPLIGIGWPTDEKYGVGRPGEQTAGAGTRDAKTCGINRRSACTADSVHQVSAADRPSVLIWTAVRCHVSHASAMLHCSSD